MLLLKIIASHAAAVHGSGMAPRVPPQGRTGPITLFLWISHNTVKSNNKTSCATYVVCLFCDDSSLIGRFNSLLCLPLQPLSTPPPTPPKSSTFLKRLFWIFAHTNSSNVILFNSQLNVCLFDVLHLVIAPCRIVIDRSPVWSHLISEQYLLPPRPSCLGTSTSSTVYQCAKVS